MKERYYIVDQWYYTTSGDRYSTGISVARIPVMPEGSAPVLGSNRWRLPNGEIVIPVSTLQYKHLTQGQNQMTHKEIELLFISLLRLLAPEDRKRLQQNLEMLNYGASCGDSNYDRKVAYERMQSIDRLKALVETPVEY